MNILEKINKLIKYFEENDYKITILFLTIKTEEENKKFLFDLLDDVKEYKYLKKKIHTDVFEDIKYINLSNKNYNFLFYNPKIYKNDNINKDYNNENIKFNIIDNNKNTEKLIYFLKHNDKFKKLKNKVKKNKIYFCDVFKYKDKLLVNKIFKKKLYFILNIDKEKIITKFKTSSNNSNSIYLNNSFITSNIIILKDKQYLLKTIETYEILFNQKINITDFYFNLKKKNIYNINIYNNFDNININKDYVFFKFIKDFEMINEYNKKLKFLIKKKKYIDKIKNCDINNLIEKDINKILLYYYS